MPKTAKRTPAVKAKRVVIAIPDLYTNFFAKKGEERLDLFRTVAHEYAIKRAMYAGSYVHVTPSFVIPDMVYVDNDKRAKAFFKVSENYAFVHTRKEYIEPCNLVFYGLDYTSKIGEPENSFDLLISQYAGLVGRACKPYLARGGLLLANDSHGDAGVAALDRDYELVGVVNQKCAESIDGDDDDTSVSETTDECKSVSHRTSVSTGVKERKYEILTNNLDEYFVPKSAKVQAQVSTDYLIALGKGVQYTKQAHFYLFKKV
ncbi:hypothetical protein SARC_02647 [Sphaeroforma arctica JP610]|uniref:PABS domain-containing protein n=1 Tax=Sphaeroforma arctica JP610 TaxID=667725 RepID=A0A0L0G8C3_9EUKA|nr:hypothetical protein SARC_02647 [Sphaeroforma arctica JP610]KNC85154.1 hypothetical protein SARC_02647 [Sphaeroforma arctica JP610]|eukprot:XP_014159056.1 hypothetical protein SARC_02647 [Sphaeroforma arctica JP610]